MALLIPHKTGASTPELPTERLGECFARRPTATVVVFAHGSFHPCPVEVHSTLAFLNAPVGPTIFAPGASKAEAPAVQLTRFFDHTPTSSVTSVSQTARVAWDRELLIVSVTVTIHQTVIMKRVIATAVIPVAISFLYRAIRIR